MMNSRGLASASQSGLQRRGLTPQNSRPPLASQKMKELTENIFLIPGRNRGAYPFCNSIYIEDEVRAVIDPASDKKELERLQDVRLAILSHFHLDHIRELRSLPGAEVAIHSSESGALGDWRKLSGLIFFADEDRAEIEAWIESQSRLFKPEQWNFRISRKLNDGDEIDLGKTRIKVIHAPGHTVGHCCFWFPEQEILFTADIDLTEFGPWYGNACSNLEEFCNSLAKLKALRPKLVVTGHEDGIVSGSTFQGRLEKFRSVVFTRENKLLDALSSPKSLDEIAGLGIIYGEFLAKAPAALKPIEKRMVIHHLKWLEQKGMAREESGRWIRA